MKIDGVEYIEIPETEFAFGNVCLECAFYGTGCYNRRDFSCHSDERPDGIGVIFKEGEQMAKAIITIEDKDLNEDTATVQLEITGRASDEFTSAISLAAIALKAINGAGEKFEQETE